MLPAPDVVGCCWPQLGLSLRETRQWAFVSSPELFVAWAASRQQLGAGREVVQARLLLCLLLRPF